MEFPKKPLIVVDLSIFRNWSSDHFPSEFDVLLSKAFFVELPTTDDNYVLLIEKLHQWLRKFDSRIWVGRLYFELESLEKYPKYNIPDNAYIDFSDTANLRQFSQSNKPSREHIEDIRSHFSQSEYIENRTKYIKFLDDYLEFAVKHSPELFNKVRGSGMQKEDVYQTVTSPECILNMLERMDIHKKYMSNEWKEALCNSPHKYALGRWIMLCLWLICRWVMGVGEKRENFWDDMHYAFLASYAGRIFTGDKGMVQCVKQVFPDCEIIDSD